MSSTKNRVSDKGQSIDFVMAQRIESVIEVL